MSDFSNSSDCDRQRPSDFRRGSDCDRQRPSDFSNGSDFSRKRVSDFNKETLRDFSGGSYFSTPGAAVVSVAVAS
jgi:hypothetical protein